MPIIHAMLNDNFLGDTESVRAITRKLSGSVEEYKDNAADVVSLITVNLEKNPDQQHILLISGTHGLEFLNNALKNSTFQEMIQNNKLVVSWSGHQAPANLKTLADNLQVVSLVKESIDPSLEKIFGARLVATKMVANSLTIKDLSTALNPDTIPNSKNGYIGVFLGGDAPDENGNHKFYSAEQALEQGKAFGLAAQKSDKVLLVTNGPRMGKLYPESPDLKKPVLTRFNAQGEWVAFEDLTTEELQTDPKPGFKAHDLNAPLDKVSTAFVAGIASSGLAADQYKFIDFKFGQSAYKAIIAALYSDKENSQAFYSGESISYAEIGYFIPNTYAFKIDSMSNRHANILQRFINELHIVGKAEFAQDDIKLSDINQVQKQATLDLGSDQDAGIVAAAIVEALPKKFRPSPGL